MPNKTFCLAVLCLLLLTRSGPAETVTFYFAPLGSSYSAALFTDDPLVDKEVTSARIYLDVESFTGSDAANFFTDILLPIEPLPGNEATVVLAGSDLNWSGSGRFTYFEETDRLNGRFIARRYGAETPGENFVGAIFDGRIELDVPDYLRGDFDDDSDLDQADIDWLADAIVVGGYSRMFDLNADGLVDLADHSIWVKQLKHAWYGDADLNGTFDSSDLIQVLGAGQYEDGIDLNSTWSTGDWNADGDFTTGDLVVALQDGGYALAPAAAAAPVPEPATLLIALLGVAAASCRRVSVDK
jgi:hypothetical protein